MRVLVIYAHPLADSLTSALHGVIIDTLRRGGHEVDDCDLYADGFDPVLSARERRAYNTATPDLSAVADHVKRLRAAEALVLCFPTWWYGMPAILKGYFDRVWANTVAFELPEGGGAIRPALNHIKKMWVVTSYGSPWWLIRLVLRDPVRSVILGGLARLLRSWLKWRGNFNDFDCAIAWLPPPTPLAGKAKPQEAGRHNKVTGMPPNGSGEAGPSTAKLIALPLAEAPGPLDCNFS